MNLDKNEIHIWRKRLDDCNSDVNKYECILSRDELEKAHRFKFEKDKNYYIVGRGTLREILSKYLNADSAKLKFSYSQNGKPSLENNKLKFNLSHSNGYAAYAFTTDDEIGIDVEYMREIPDILQVSERFFSEMERDELNKIGENQLELGFFNCWTRKEAFLKAIGDGLSYPLENFSVTLNPKDEPKIFWIKDHPDKIKFWSLYNLPAAIHYVSSVAIKAKDKKIVIKN